MKIDYALVACDDNPKYLDFWPIVARLWLRLGIEPVLLYFGEKEIEGHGGKVINVNSFASINKEDYPLATCWVRYWFPSFMPNKTFIISDIDMLPFSKWYFVDQLKDLPEDSYVHLNPCIETYSRLPSCYHVAKGSRFKEVLELDDVFERSFNYLKSLSFYNPSDAMATGIPQWCYDEFYASELIMRRKDITLIKRAGGESGHRADRTNWVYDETNVYEIYDSHSLRPYSEHKEQIDKIIKSVTGWSL